MICPVRFSIFYNSSFLLSANEVAGRWWFLTITYDALDLTIQDPHSLHPPPPGHGTSLYRDPPQTCSNLFNLDLNVQGPPPLLDMFKLVHYEVCTVGKWLVDILLECFFVTAHQWSCGKGMFSVMCVHKKGTSCVTRIHWTSLYRSPVQGPSPPAKRSKCKLLGKLTKNHVIKDLYTYYKCEKNEHLRKKHWFILCCSLISPLLNVIINVL